MMREIKMKEMIEIKEDTYEGREGKEDTDEGR